MTSAFPRALSERERALLDLLLAEAFPGVEALRVQAQSVRVRGLWEGLPAVVLLEVCDPAAPRAEVVHPVPVETHVRGTEPPQELLLFVWDGVLDSIELLNPAEGLRELPDVASFERPWVKPPRA